MLTIKKRHLDITNSIELSTKSANRPAGSVQLLAVSKTWPAALLREATQAGQHCFGENYLQEALIKIEELADLNLEWHFIGPIQSNKTKDIATSFDWVQSLDRLKIAQRLSNQRPSGSPSLNICIQVNIDDEHSKSGVAIIDVLAFAEQIDKLEYLSLRGLMVLPSKTDDAGLQRIAFQKSHQLFEQLKLIYPSVDTLSMGMSDDMESAIAEGSTMVRIGTALFGKRTTRS